MERIPYTYINKRNLERYEGHLGRAGRSQNTISTYMRRLRCVYYRAVEAGEAPYVPGLFKDVFTGVESRRKRALTAPEMSRMMSAPVKGERLLRARLALCLMFLFGGMAFVDFAHLTAGNLGDGRLLSYKRRKTGVTIRLELPPVAGELAGPLWVEGGRQVPVPLPRRRARGEGGLPRVRGGAGPFQPRLARVGEVLRGDLPGEQLHDPSYVRDDAEGAGRPRRGDQRAAHDADLSEEFLAGAPGRGEQGVLRERVPAAARGGVTT